MKIVHSGFDSIYFAVQGALKPEAEKHLEDVKERAVKDQLYVPFKCHSGTSKYHLQPNGKKGGYAYVIDTGHIGSIISIKTGLSRKDWNGFVEMKSASLLCFGWEQAIENAFNQLKALGFHRVSISMNRIDFCIDFLNANLRLDPTHFVAHSRVKKTSHYETTVRDKHVEKVAVAQSSHVQSITLGKMPGRQVIVYDKRREVIEKRKLYWFKAWGVNRHDPTLDVYRVELRAGKKELQKYNIASLDAFKRHTRLALLDASKAVRYVLPRTNDTNVSRAPLHPLWEAVQKRLSDALKQHQKPIEADLIFEHMRETKALEYEKQIIGNLGGWLGCKGVEHEQVGRVVEHLLQSNLARANEDSQHPIWKSYSRIREQWVM